MSFISQPRKK